MTEIIFSYTRSLRVKISQKDWEGSYFFDSRCTARLAIVTFVRVAWSQHLQNDWSLCASQAHESNVFRLQRALNGAGPAEKKTIKNFFEQKFCQN